MEAAQARAEETRKQAEAESADLRSQVDAAVTERAHAVKALQEQHDTELSRVKQEMQQRIDELSRSLQESESARVRAEKRAEGNSLSRYLLTKLRGQDASSASGDDGDAGQGGGSDKNSSSKGGSRE